jgi:hypothetical protein
MSSLFASPRPPSVWTRWKWALRAAAVVVVFVLISPRACLRGRARGDVSDDLVNTLMSFDRNGDGKLDRSEVPERMQGIFERGDTNRDGVLTLEEIRKLAKTQALPDR